MLLIVLSLIVFLLFLVSTGFFICFIYIKKKYNLQNQKYNDLFAKNFSLDNENSLLKEKNSEYIKKIDIANDKLLNANEQIILYKTKSEMINDFDKRFTEQFTNISNSVLMKNSNNFISIAKEELANATESLRNRFIEYEQNHAKTAIELQTNAKNFNDMMYRLGKEIDKVTKAFYGNNKIHGTWGEMILEKALEIAGLQLGIHYDRQKSVSTSEASNIRPDIIINLPDNQKIIIDSKLSFKRYYDYVNCINNDEKPNLLKEMKILLKNHIDSLYKKGYQNYHTNDNVYHTIFMFIPIESLFILLIHDGKENLIKYAYDRNIILASPQTLLINLKNIRYFFSSFEREKNTQDAFQDLEKILSKIVRSLNSFNDIGVTLSVLNKKYDKLTSFFFYDKSSLKNNISSLKTKYDLNIKELKDNEYISQNNFVENKYYIDHDSDN